MNFDTIWEKKSTTQESGELYFHLGCPILHINFKHLHKRFIG